MSPAAGGAAPTQPPPAAAGAGPSPPPAAAIAAPEPERAPPPQANRRDPAGSADGADPGNAAARKTAWNVPAPPLAAAPAPVGGIMGGGPGSWPALAESAARVAPKSASSDSLKSLSDGSAPSASEDLILPSLQPHPVANPISGASNPTSSSPPPNATAVANSQQNGNADQPNPVRHGGGASGGTSGGGHSAGSNSSRDGNTSDGGDGNWNDGGLGCGSGSNSSYGHGSTNMNNIIHSSGTSSSVYDNIRRASGNNNWNNNGCSGGSNHNAAGSGDGSNRNSTTGGNLWNNNGRNGSGSSSNGFGGRGGNRNRRDHERGGSFSPRNYPRHAPPQQQPGIYQPGPFPRPPPPPPPAHFMVPQPIVPYVPHFAYPADVQAYPFYLPPVEQFQNMHLVRPQMQPVWVQGQQNLQEDIRTQIEFYFSTNNLCHDTYLRRHMNDQGWVPIDLITQFNRVSFVHL
ncbi:hypothetical protein E2562_028016 [Oryza meyeriana var. granulata]|uniref:HTH La-type RNA-binding domain-containing protein n=1 Tax=Oryza meyeriana var. granulata TaxID=110450 RepID=A0A6G1CVM6_9ORYZ|nr:hypothetical protein E2562_028016 [Oryza meyeriana var. granulata]